MSYSSLVYLFIFLPITLIIYALVPKKHKWKVLLIASYIFFYSISGKLIVYLLFSTLSIHHFGLWLERINDDRDKEIAESDKELKKEIKQRYKKQSFKVVMLAVLIHIGLLIVLKYSRFIGGNINSLFKLLHLNYQLKISKFLIPIGISFYTLQGLSYIFDVYNGTIKADRNLGRLALFMAFFPQLMEGPIARYSNTAEDLYKGEAITYKNMTFGAQRILWGLMKVLVVATRLNPFVKTIFKGYKTLDGSIILIGAIAYTIQLYMDFSGTIDIAIGSAEIFGIKLPENFRQPFFSKNISDFWSRWHITLGTWFKDYIFYPLSLSKQMKKLTLNARKVLGNYFGPLLAGAVALFAVWFSNGIWHGAAWMYIFFGMYHFSLILLGKIFTPVVVWVTDKLHIKRTNFIYQGIQIIKTTCLVVIGELFFRAHGLKAGLIMFKKIFTDFHINKIFSESILKLGIDYHDMIIVGVIVLLVFVISILKEKNINVRENIANKNIVIRWSLYYALILIIIIFGAYGAGYTPIDPMYANF